MGLDAGLFVNGIALAVPEPKRSTVSVAEEINSYLGESLESDHNSLGVRSGRGYKRLYRHGSIHHIG
jgi:hypothetical protein